ncbi:hypothetical protein GCM10007923_14830 [Shinella yambaruensis]|uniref:Uncharacterized protein n=1 Tax=Shinella yambaruensis TaxID=415996 RepID=A0ABQ5ZEX8_9HYPH|nr:hypothetical protein GCM10007923_14830 [Shinella yambaruensis]
MKERWEIDLSPGMRTVPDRPEDLRAVAGRALAPCDMVVFLIYIHGSPEGITRGERGLATTNDLKRHHPV